MFQIVKGDENEYLNEQFGLYSPRFCQNIMLVRLNKVNSGCNVFRFSSKSWVY